MFGVCIEGTQPIIVMEYCSGGLSVNKKQTHKQTNTSQFISLSQLFKLTTHNHTKIYIENTHCIVSFSHLFVIDIDIDLEVWINCCLTKKNKFQMKRKLNGFMKLH
jgi:hypothetical protein